MHPIPVKHLSETVDLLTVIQFL